MVKYAEWFTSKKKAAVGVCLIILGILFTLFGPREGNLGAVEYFLYAMGGLSFINILFSKVTKNNMNYVLYLLVNGAGASLIIAMVSIVLDTWSEGTKAGFVIFIMLLMWVAHMWMIPEAKVVKRLVLSFLCMICNSGCMVTAFFLIAIIRMK